MAPKKVRKHLVHDFCSTKTGMHRHIHKPGTRVDVHTHTHTSQIKFTQSLTIFLFNTSGKMMLKMLNIFPKLKSIWDNTHTLRLTSISVFIFFTLNLNLEIPYKNSEKSRKTR